LEAPLAPLVGRDAILQQCLTPLQTGAVVNLIGGSGFGKTSLGAAVAAEWRATGASTTHAHELRGNLLAQRGDIQTALNEYRASLDTQERLQGLQPVTVRVRMARHNLIRLREGDAARHEALLARHHVEIVLGEIEEEAGRLDAAYTHFQTALEAAREVNEPVSLAKAYAHLGRLEESESLCWSALAHEEAVVRPYCLYVLGDVRRQQRQWRAAEQFCQEALASAEANRDPLALGPAWCVLGEVYVGGQRMADARAAFEAARQVYAKAGVLEEVAWVQARPDALA